MFFLTICNRFLLVIVSSIVTIIIIIKLDGIYSARVHLDYLNEVDWHQVDANCKAKLQT